MFVKHFVVAIRDIALIKHFSTKQLVALVLGVEENG
jgi:hypothetical protein